ncbi:MAG: T9SS type A sorting domain-containing protein [Bacteroidota bacterium]
MKKQLLALFACISLLGINSSNAQLSAGKIAPDFTAVDINGNTWNLYSILDSGKTVFMDISATWCGPCWNYHTSGILEDLYNTYGPSGTNEVMVFFDEGEDQNTTAQLYGPANLSGSAATQTQGDWVTGTPYPIIDDASIASLYQINYFPTIYMICPDRIIREIGQQASAAAFIAAKNSECFSAVDVNDAGIANSMNDLNGTLASCNAVDVSYRLCNYGTAPLTSATIDLEINGVVANTYNWTGSLNTYESTTLTFNGVSPSAGNNIVTVRTSNPNGAVDAIAANDSKDHPVIRYAPVGGTLSAPQTFTTTAFPPADWLQLTPAAYSPYIIRSTAGNGNSGSAKIDFWNASSGDQDILQMPQLDLTVGASPYLFFDVTHRRYNTTNDNLKVEVSTNCGATWIAVYNKSGAALATSSATNPTSSYTPTATSVWRRDSVSLINYAAQQNVFIRFKATSAYGDNAYLDNINIQFASTGIGSISKPVSFEVYPNPATDRSSVDFVLDTKEDIALDVINNLGATVYSRSEKGMGAGEYTFEIPTAGLSSGIYSVIVRTSQGASTRKLVVK